MKKSYQNKYSAPLFSPADAGLVHGMKNDKGAPYGKRKTVICKHLRLIAFVLGLMGSFFLLDSLMLAVIHQINFRNGSRPSMSRGLQDGRRGYVDEENTEKIMYGRLVSLASSALAKNEFQRDPFTLWEEPYKQASTWKPCANKHYVVRQGHAINNTGYILVSANGGLNQQRVAVCNAVAVAALLNATLVIPKFLYSSVWKDDSQFGDIYQEEYFVNLLKDDVHIVKELPSHLQSLDIEALGSQITDMDIMKESKLYYFGKVILPLLRRNGVVHFLGFGNRLAFDPLPSYLQGPKIEGHLQSMELFGVGSLLMSSSRKQLSNAIKDCTKQSLDVGNGHFSEQQSCSPLTNYVIATDASNCCVGGRNLL